MPQLLGLGVLWVVSGVGLVRTRSPSQRHVLNHRHWYSWEGGRCVALRARLLSLMMWMVMDHVDDAL